MLSTFLTMATQQANPGQQAGAGLMGLLPIAIIFVIFYFLLIRPQKKSQQEHKQILEKLAKNDEVITSGGIFGTVVKINDDVVTLRIAKDTKVKLRKSAISNVIKSRTEVVSG